MLSAWMQRAQAEFSISTWNQSGHLAGLLGGTVTLVRFQRWVGPNGLAIELHGSDDDLELLNLIDVRLAEYTSDYINAAELLDALQTDPLAQQELRPHRTAVA